MRRAVGDFIPKTEAWDGTDHFRIGLDLQRLGVIEGLSGLEQLFIMSSSTPKIFIKGEQVLLVYGNDGAEVRIPAISVTRLGQEVFSLLTPSESKSTLRSLAELFKIHDSVQNIEMGAWTPEGVGIQFFREEVILDRK